jgi:hypothetical protein
MISVSSKRLLIQLTFVYIFFQVLNNISIEELTELGIKGHVILIGRSIICLTISVLLAYYKRGNIVPQKLKTQYVRLALSGCGLLLITQSYQFLSATSVAAFQRLDIAFIVFISIIIGRYKFFDKILFVIANALTVACIITLSGSIDEQPAGYFLALSGVLLISISNFFVQKTALQENFYIFVNTACISCIIVGICFGLYKGFEIMFSVRQIIGLFLSGLSMFGLYFCLMEFYKQFTIEKAQYPSVVAAFLVLFVEMIVEQKWFSPLFILLNILLLVIITLTIKQKVMPVDNQE